VDAELYRVGGHGTRSQHHVGAARRGCGNYCEWGLRVKPQIVLARQKPGESEERFAPERPDGF